MSGFPITKDLLAAIALVLTSVAFFPYIRSILRKETKPHVFSWLIWGAGTILVFAAQLVGGAGVGAWPVGVSGVITCSVAILALTRSADTTIVKMDWIFLALALSALPLWFFTSSPLAAVIVLTVVDLLGFAPSIRKAFDFPHEENALFFGIGALRNAFVVAALQNYSWTTVLFPAAVGATCLLFAVLILWRRQIVAAHPSRAAPKRPGD